MNPMPPSVTHPKRRSSAHRTGRRAEHDAAVAASRTTPTRRAPMLMGPGVGYPDSAGRSSGCARLDARTLQVDHGRLVEVRRLDREADRAREPLAPLDELLLRRLGRLLAVPEDDRLGAPVLAV